MRLFTAIEIEINSNCNMACSYCPNSMAKRIEQGFMSRATYEKILFELMELKFDGRISYDFYNEPTLSPDLVYFVKLTKEKLPLTTIELYSNGSKLNLSLFNELEMAGIDKFIITKHENIESYEFDKTYSALTKVQKEKVDYRSFSKLKLTNRGGMLKHIGESKLDLTLPCFIPNGMLTITNKGNVVPCFEDFYQKNVMGNIHESSLLDIWNSDKYVLFRKKLSMGLRSSYQACNDCSRTEVVFEQM